MTLEKLINKYNDNEVNKIILNYDGCISEFDSIIELEDEAYNYGFIDEAIKKYTLKNSVLKIEM